ncbi:MAG TPA: hypothetical protein VL337_15720, partial [Acidimicrobiales bacterium]|nr:hypothetical protein [Acidimicrobiales bacterium]
NNFGLFRPKPDESIYDEGGNRIAPLTGLRSGQSEIRISVSGKVRPHEGKQFAQIEGFSPSRARLIEEVLYSGGYGCGEQTLRLFPRSGVPITSPNPLLPSIPVVTLGPSDNVQPAVSAEFRDCGEVEAGYEFIMIVNVPLVYSSNGKVEGGLPAITVLADSDPNGASPTPLEATVLLSGVAEPRFSVGFSDLTIEPAPVAPRTLSWRSTGSLYSRWSWEDRGVEARVRSIQTIASIFAGVAGSALVALIGAFVKRVWG